MALRNPSSEPALPWWRVGMVWLVLAGPLAVVVAGTATAVIALRDADPPVAVRAAPADEAAATQPALQARNHAATARQPR